MNLTKSVLYTAVVAMTIAACDSDPSPKTTGDISKLSANARNYLSMKMANANNASAQESGIGRGTPINDSFQRLYSQAAAGGRIRKDSTEVSDSVIYENPWVSCAQTSTIENSDGSITSIIDYGDGCEEGYEGWKYFMHGRLEYTYRFVNENDGVVWHDSYQYDSKSTNYGGSYSYEGETYSWVMNGVSSYGGSSVYNTETQEYSGQYSYTANDSYQWDGTTYQSIGSSKTSYSNQQSVTEESDFMYKTNDDFYHNVAVTPLVARYDCWNNYYAEASENATSDEAIAMCYYVPYVSGIEQIAYKQGSEEGSFQIDYGDGECDSKVIIIENGERVEVDLSLTAPADLAKN